ncbi:MAG: hypothetical protein JNK72_21050 [Myxococcales bacterium]|nr:hypothetical protein [Myxococcales bacterium]
MLATLAALTLGVALQVTGAEAVLRSGLTPGEHPVDAVIASLEPEGGIAPRYALRSEYVLLLRADLQMRGAPEALTTAVDRSVSTAVLEWLLGELAVVREAERGGAGDPDPSALSQTRQRVVAQLGGDPGVAALLSATGLTASEFDTLLRRRTVAQAWLLERHPRLIEPDDSAVREAFESGQFAQGYRAEATLGEARRVIRQRLIEARYPAALRLYLRGLGSRVRVRVFVDP